MHLLVVRHGIAEQRIPNEDDAARRLTRDGVRKVRGVVRGLRTLGWSFDRVLTSPWLRAARTAELLDKLCATDPIATELLARAPSAELLALIAQSVGPERPRKRRRRATALVGHEPWLAQLVAWLAFGDGRHGEALALKKGSVVWLEGTAAPGGMTIRAILPAAVLGAL